MAEPGLTGDGGVDIVDSGGGGGGGGAVAAGLPLLSDAAMHSP